MVATSRLLKKLQMQGAARTGAERTGKLLEVQSIPGGLRSYVSTGSVAATQQMDFFSSLLQGMPD